MQTFETQRLFIRPFTMEDVNGMYQEIYSPEAGVWGPHTREKVADGVMMAMLMGRSSDDAPWAKRAVTLKDGRFIGQVRLSPSHNYFYRWEEEPTPRYNELEVELMFCFGKRWWGQSYAYEASQAMIRYAFDDLNLHRLVNGTGDDNPRSIALHQRLSFRIFRALPLAGHEYEGIVAVLNNDRH